MALEDWHASWYQELSMAPSAWLLSMHEQYHASSVNVTGLSEQTLYIDDFIQDCSISIANTLEILQSYTNP